jgi:ferredoxin
MLVMFLARRIDLVRITIDREQCMGSGNCAFWAPSTFDLDDDMKAIVVDSDGDSLEKVRNAVEACPTHALALVDEASS